MARHRFSATTSSRRKVDTAKVIEGIEASLSSLINTLRILKTIKNELHPVRNSAGCYHGLSGSDTCSHIQAADFAR